MKNNTDRIQSHLNILIKRYPVLENCYTEILEAYKIIAKSYESGHKLLVAGNGGSAADAEHIVGELMKKFRIGRHVDAEMRSSLLSADKKRGAFLSENLEPGLAAVALVANESLSTAVINDIDGNCVYAQQLLCYGERGDSYLGISTSGNSQNIMNAAVVARAKGIKIIALTGETGGEIGRYADVAVRVPENETYIIQELHLPIYHCWCMMLEERFFGV